MAKETDRRVRKTRALLRRSLAELLCEKSIREITVKELVERADINRSTFYLHYSDVYDMMEKIENGLVDDIEKLIEAHPVSPFNEKSFPFIEDIFVILAENRYVGVSCGRLDQSCEVYCRKDHLLYMDMKDGRYELIPTAFAMPPYRIVVFFSGLERSLASSKFNMRGDECRAAAYALKALAGLDYGKFEATNLRDVPYAVYLRYRDRLPESWARRAEHWYSEFERVEKGAQAWRNGDLAAFGRLVFESGRSSIDNWETGSPELIRLYEIMTHTDGIYGGRFSGAGFKGCCMALIDPAFEESILKTVEREYLAAFPALRGKYSAHVCRSADGVRLKK